MSAGRVKWVKKMPGVICDKKKSRSTMKGLQEDNSTNNSEWLGDSGTVKETGGRAGGGIVKVVEILFGRDKDGQDKE